MVWAKNLMEILDQENQPIESNKPEPSAHTLSTTFHKPAGEANPNVRFGYAQQTIFHHTRGQILL